MWQRRRLVESAEVLLWKKRRGEEKATVPCVSTKRKCSIACGDSCTLTTASISGSTSTLSTRPRFDPRSLKFCQAESAPLSVTAHRRTTAATQVLPPLPSVYSGALGMTSRLVLCLGDLFIPDRAPVSGIHACIIPHADVFRTRTFPQR